MIQSQIEMANQNSQADNVLSLRDEWATFFWKSLHGQPLQVQRTTGHFKEVQDSDVGWALEGEGMVRAECKAKSLPRSECAVSQDHEATNSCNRQGTEWCSHDQVREDGSRMGREAQDVQQMVRDRKQSWGRNLHSSTDRKSTYGGRLCDPLW